MEGIIRLELLPAWVVGLIMIYTAVIWLITRTSHIRMDSKIVAYTLIAWGTLYLLSIFSPGENAYSHLETRVFLSRVVICFICLSQSVPMTISYIRSRVRGGEISSG